MDPLVATERKLMAYTAFRDLCNAHRNGIGKSVARGYAYAIRNFLMKNDGSLDVTAKAMPRLHGIWSSLEKKKPTKGAKALNNSIVLDMFKFLNENTYDDCIWRATYAFAHNAVKRPNQYTTLKPVLSQLTWNGSCPGWKVPKVVHFCIFSFNKSKTNTTGKEEWAVLIC
eukprot:701911_1